VQQKQTLESLETKAEAEKEVFKNGKKRRKFG